MSPMLQTKVPGIGVAYIHSPERFCTWNCIMEEFIEIIKMESIIKSKHIKIDYDSLLNQVLILDSAPLISRTEQNRLDWEFNKNS
jgi:hypothetical protein